MPFEEHLYPIENTEEKAEKLRSLVHGAENILDCFSLNVKDKTPPKSIEEFREKKSGKVEVDKGREKLLILVDKDTDPMVKEALFIAGSNKAGDNFEFFEVSTSTKPGEPFSDEINKKLTTADAVLVVSKYSRTYSPGMVALRNPQPTVQKLSKMYTKMKTTWDSQELLQKYPYLAATDPTEWHSRITAQDAHPFEGSPALSRFISMSNVTIETLERAQYCDSPEIIEARTEKLAEKMKDVEEIEIITGDNLKITFKLASSRGLRDDGNVQYRGQGGNFPYGELAFAPDLTSATGFIKIDCAAGGIGVLEEPIVLEFLNGRIVNITGGKTAEKYMSLLAKAEQKDSLIREASLAEIPYFPSPFYLGEFGIGLNSGIKPFDESGNVRKDLTTLEAEKILDSVHLALGQTAVPWAPTKNTSSIHSDMTILHSQVNIRKKGQATFEPLIQEGKLLL